LQKKAKIHVEISGIDGHSFLGRSPAEAGCLQILEEAVVESGG